jgi:hypothetical protein
MKSSNTIAKKAKNQAKSRQVRTRFSPFATRGLYEQQNSKNQAKSRQVWTRFSPFATHEIKQYHSNKDAQIKQSQGESERGFVLCPGVTLDEIDGEMMQKKQNQAKRSQV